MTLHLIRHAHAVGADENPLRPLSPRGRVQAAGLASFLRASRLFHPAAIWHSPLARARETAALLAQGLAFAGPLVEISGLEPEDDPRLTAARLANAPDGLVVVGHEPHLGALAALLLRGQEGIPVVLLKKGSSLALDRENGAWHVRWLIAPEMIGAEP